METTAEIVRVSGPYSIKIAKVKVRARQKVSKGTIFCVYATKGRENQKLKSDTVGIVTEVFVEEGQELQPGDKIVSIEGCSHPTVMKDMCADCGADLRMENSIAGDRKGEVSASVAMVHNIPELIVSEKMAHELGKADEDRLLKTRKLVLLVDLDQTLIHTTNDNIPPNLKDVHHYQMRHGKQLLWYHTRLRPHTQAFLENISRLYELHICTFGARLYAHTIAKILDPKGKYFSTRILSRDECFNATSKTANLKALFPCGDGMVCIIDDREDVWNFSPNLVHVKPYRFFQGTADINAPPGLAKTEHDEEPMVHRERRVSQSSTSSTNSSDGRSPSRSNSVDNIPQSAKEMDRKSETKTNKQHEQYVNVDETNSLDSEMVERTDVTDATKQIDKLSTDGEDKMEVDVVVDKVIEPGNLCVKDNVSEQDNVISADSESNTQLVVPDACDKNIDIEKVTIEHDQMDFEKIVEPEHVDLSCEHNKAEAGDQIDNENEKTNSQGKSKVDEINRENSDNESIEKMDQEIGSGDQETKQVKYSTDGGDQNDNDAETKVESPKEENEKTNSQGKPKVDEINRENTDIESIEKMDQEIGSGDQETKQVKDSTDGGDQNDNDAETKGESPKEENEKTNLQGKSKVDEINRENTDDESIEKMDQEIVSGDQETKQVKNSTDGGDQNDNDAETRGVSPKEENEKTNSQGKSKVDEIKRENTDIESIEKMDQEIGSEDQETKQVKDSTDGGDQNDNDAETKGVSPIEENEKTNSQGKSKVDEIDRENTDDESIEKMDQEIGSGDQETKQVKDSTDGGDQNDNDAETKGESPKEEEVWLEWDDEDDYLFYLEESLVKIHTAFYDIHDQLKKKEANSDETEKPDLKNIIPYIKRKVLKGCNIVFSGVIPTNMQIENHRAYIVATALGASVQDSFIPKKTDSADATTHVIAAKTGTSKVRSALKHKNCHIVSVNWLWSCIERWERVEESLFPLSDSNSNSKCESPDVSKKDGGCKRKSDDTDTPDDIFCHDSKRQKKGSNNIEVDSSKESMDSTNTDSQPVSKTPAVENRFCLSYNPLYSFSDEDMEGMDKEVDDILEEDNDSSEDDIQRESRMRDRVLKSADHNSSSDESLSGDMPRGWRMKKKLSPKSSSSDDDSKVGSPHHEQQIAQEYESETEMDRFEKTIEAFAPDSDSDSYQESIGSVDDELADAVEKEFLS